MVVMLTNDNVGFNISSSSEQKYPNDGGEIIMESNNKPGAENLL